MHSYSKSVTFTSAASRFPGADTTTYLACGSALTMSATLRMDAAFAMLVPPNFNTFMLFSLYITREHAVMLPSFVRFGVAVYFAAILRASR